MICVRRQKELLEIQKKHHRENIMQFWALCPTGVNIATNYERNEYACYQGMTEISGVKHV